MKYKGVNIRTLLLMILATGIACGFTGFAAVSHNPWYLCGIVIWPLIAIIDCFFLE